MCLFKIHESDRFVELIYFVVNPNCQKMGIGKLLMNKFKEFSKNCQHSLTRIVTFADNNATDFFKKNGFSKLSQQQKQSISGSIENYQRATLMGFPFVDGAFDIEWNQKVQTRSSGKQRRTPTPLGFENTPTPNQKEVEPKVSDFT